MKIEIDETGKFIKIKDIVRFQYFIQYLLLGMIIANAIIWFIKLNQNYPGWLEIIWIIMGVVGIILLLYLLFKKSAAEKIDIDKIDSLKEKTVFGRKRFYIKLKNGKQRNLYELNSKSQITELKKHLIRSELVSVIKNKRLLTT